MTETGKELNMLLGRFAEAMKCGSFPEDLFMEDAELFCSHMGNGTGREAARLLPHPDIQTEAVKQNLESLLLHWNGDKAQMSFHLHQLFIKHAENGEFHYFQYGGTFVLSCVDTEKGWKIRKLLFDLCWTEGNTYWVSDWKLIDFHMPKRHKALIRPERDGVWNVIPRTEEPQSEEEKIKELLFLYGWVIDTEDYALFSKIAVPGICIRDGYHGTVFQGTENWISFLKELNAKEPCLHHTYQVKEIIAGEKRAAAKMCRLEPNRIGSKTINGDTWIFDWLTLDYTVALKKEEGLWKLEEVEFKKNIRGVPAYET